MNWQNEVDSITNKYLESFGNLDAGMLNWKPDPETWSIAEIIQHLIQVNESYFPIFKAMETQELKLPFLARFRFMSSFFGNLILKSVDPDNIKKVKTFPLWKPASSNLDKDIFQKFKESQEILKKHIERLDKEIRSGKVIYSPANRNIVYGLDTALEIITQHQKRHYNQARNIFREQEK